MPRTFRLAIIPVYEVGFNPTAALGQAIDEMFIANAAGEAVVQYWSDVTGGYLDIKPTRLPWRQAPRAFAPQDIMQIPNVGPKITRPNLLSLFKQVVGDLPGMSNGGHGSYDGLVYVLFPGADSSILDANGNPIPCQFEGGNWTTGGDLPTAILPAGTASHTHTFFTHEVGHLFGFPDSQGIFRWNGTTWDSGYGDPLEIMSAQAWFTGDPTFQGQAVANWPAMSGGGQATDSMGPAPSLALLHFWDANCIPAIEIHDLQVADDNTPSFRLNAAYGANKSRRLAVIRAAASGKPEPADGIGRVYLEFRDRRGWDRGLDKVGALRTRTSVVVHVVQSAPGIPPQPYYKGQIIVPVEVDTDLQIPGSPFTVRVLQSGEGYVTLKVTRSAARGFKVDAEVEQAGVQFNPHVQAIRLTPCGDRLRWGTWKTKTVGVYTATAWGYGGSGGDMFGPGAPPAPGGGAGVAAAALTLNWFVGGVPVPEQQAGTLVGCQAPEGQFDLSYDLDLATRRLQLTSRFGDRFSMPVRAQLIDNVLGGSENHDEVFEATGSYVGYPPEDVGKLARCGARLASELKIDPDVFRLPDGRGPRPNWQDRFKVLVSQFEEVRPQSVRTLDKLRQIGSLMVQPTEFG